MKSEAVGNFGPVSGRHEVWYPLQNNKPKGLDAEKEKAGQVETKSNAKVW